LILSNIPAKAGGPVLEDFIRRSAALLKPQGRALVVVVQTLAGFFRSQLSEAGAPIHCEESGPEHCVFVYGPVSKAASDQPEESEPISCGPGFFNANPFYVRKSVECTLEESSLRLDTVHGAPGFDDPGIAALAAAKLLRRLGPEKLNMCGCPGADSPDCGGSSSASSSRNTVLLFHEAEQGAFPLWLLQYIGIAHNGEKCRGAEPMQLVLSGRNILALEAARHNIEKSVYQKETAELSGINIKLFPAADMHAIREGPFAFIAAFPELVPQCRGESKKLDQLETLWKALTGLLGAGGAALITLPSSEAERFDRKKPAGFTRLGDIKRQGFRALAYRHG
jgi:hypothetical protein